MCVQVVDLVCINTCIAHGVEHGAARTVHVRGGHVPSVSAHAVATELGVNLGTSGLGVFVLLEHHHASPFTQHKTIAVLVPGARSGSGVVVTRRQGSHSGKAAHAQWRHGAFGASGDHDIRIAVLDQTTGFANAVQAGGASGDHGQVGAFETIAHRHMTGNHVDDRSRHKKWGNPARTASGVFNVGFFNEWQTTDARTHHHTHAASLFLTQRITRGQTGILDGLGCCGNAVMNETVHGSRLFGGNVGLEVKILDFTRDPARHRRSVETGDGTNAGLTGDQVGPCLGHRVAHGADASQTRDNNAAPGHRRSGLLALGVIDCSLHRGDFFCVFVRNFDAELVFECHHQFHSVQGVGTQIGHEGFFVGDL